MFSNGVQIGLVPIREKLYIILIKKDGYIVFHAEVEVISQILLFVECHVVMQALHMQNLTT